MNKTKQLCLMSYDATTFQENLNNYLEKGYKVVPTTLAVSVNDGGYTVWCVVVEQQID